MLKKGLVLLLGAVTLLLVPAFSLAQEEPASSGVAIPDIYPLPPTQPGFLGQDHFYTVTFRGNGEAVVALKVALTNKFFIPLTKDGTVTLTCHPKILFIKPMLFVFVV